MLWLIPTIAIGGGMLWLSRRARASSGTTAGDDTSRDRDLDPEPRMPEVTGTLVERAQRVRVLATAIGAPPVWADVLALIARGESGGDPLRMLGIKTGAPNWADGGGSSAVEVQEAKAAREVYDSGRKHVGDCGWAADLYAFGSGGLYGILPMSGIKAFWGDPVLRCLHPWSVFDEKIATIMAAHFADRLQQRSGYKGKVWSLRRGWGIPGGMSSAPAKKLAKWGEHAQSIGMAPSFLDRDLPRWKPLPAATMFAAIGASPDWLPNPDAYGEVA